MTNEIKINSAFKELLKSDKRYIVAFGGRGSSKTHHIILKLLFKSFDNEYNHIIYVNKEFRNIRDQQYSTIKMVAKQIGIYDHFRWYDGDYRILNKITGTQLTPIGMDDPEKTKGIVDATTIWWDECNKGTLDDFTTLNALLRTPKNKHQFIISFNPVSPKLWMRDFFFAEDPYQVKESLKDLTYLSITTFKDNKFIDQEQYERTLRINAGKNLAKLECDLFGRWGNITVDNLFIFNLDKDRHLDPDLTLNTTNYIEISMDFNVNPMTALIFQKDMFYRWIHCIEEIRLQDSDIYEMAELIKRKYPTGRLFVYGDASGWNRSHLSRGHKTTFDILKEELRLAPSQIKQPRGKGANYVSDKRNLANAILGRHPNFKIGNCPFLIEDIENVTADSTGHMNKSKDATKSHLLDCFTDYIYAACKDWHKYIK